MAELTGVLAVILVFLSGPYRTLQKRLPRSWGPVLSVWAHGNVSLASAAVVFVHLLIVGKLGFNFLELSVDGLTWIATLLLGTSLFSGFFGLYIATGPKARQRWLRFHRSLTSVFYLAVIPHVVTEGIIRWPVFILLVAAWAITVARSRIGEALSQISWPLSSGRKEPKTLGNGRRLPRITTAIPVAAGLLVLTLTAVGLFVVFNPSDEGEVEIYGRITDVQNGSFTLHTREGPVQIEVSGETEIEDGRELAALQRDQVIVEVEGTRQSDGSVLAAEIELGGEEYDG